MGRSRGFSLIEVAVASAIAGIIATAAVASFALINRQLVRLQSESVASDHAKNIIDLLVTDMQGVGGGPVRPWMAIWLEDGDGPDPFGRNGKFNKPAGTSDRLTWATIVPAAPVCTVAAVAGTVLTATSTDATTCCLTQLLTTGAIPGTGSVHTYMVRGRGHRQITLTSINGATCSATFVPGPLAPIDRPGPDAAFANAALAAVSIKTLYLTPARELRSFSEKRGINGGNVTIDLDETERVAGDVVDFQVQLGFDQQRDGRIHDRSSADDEWLYNDPADDAGAFRLDELRMVGLGVVVAVKLTDPDYQSSARIAGGQRITASRTHLRGAMGRAGFRNLFVFF